MGFLPLFGVRHLLYGLVSDGVHEVVLPWRLGEGLVGPVAGQGQILGSFAGFYAQLPAYGAPLRGIEFLV